MSNERAAGGQTRYHVGFDLESIVRRGEAARLAGQIYFNGSADPATEAEIIAHAVILRAQGLKTMPVCTNYDSFGNCIGHTNM